ncbi:MAG: hypothetical protein HY730_08315 [Candidatus Tectomicrobia bacterium]|uniref:Uncharacterized protein n=1 Tax=Tectimicrobiota bacterium TaxID=2528274 RepID=A0A933GN26_UNCTE|nr:hypothetical protein [Candidatus Tectomicrobia bacterium]
MPVFSQRPIQVAVGKAREIPAEMMEEYKKHIEALEKSNEGVLEFGEGEDIRLGRRALVEASLALKQYIVVRKERGSDNKLIFRRISKKEFDEAQASIKARVAKMTGKKRRGRPKGKAAAKAAVKAVAKKKPGRKPAKKAAGRKAKK